MVFLLLLCSVAGYFYLLGKSTVFERRVESKAETAAVAK